MSKQSDAQPDAETISLSPIGECPHCDLQRLQAQCYLLDDMLDLFEARYRRIARTSADALIPCGDGVTVQDRWAALRLHINASIDEIDAMVAGLEEANRQKRRERRESMQ